jgi:ferredoxin-like protein FixX
MDLIILADGNKCNDDLIKNIITSAKNNEHRIKTITEREMIAPLHHASLLIVYCPLNTYTLTQSRQLMFSVFECCIPYICVIRDSQVSNKAFPHYFFQRAMNLYFLSEYRMLKYSKQGLYGKILTNIPDLWEDQLKKEEDKRILKHA